VRQHLFINAARDIHKATPSVCLSVCLSPFVWDIGMCVKTAKHISKFFHRRISLLSGFLGTKYRNKIRMGHP